jgi:hypothetical protein
MSCGKYIIQNNSITSVFSMSPLKIRCGGPRSVQAAPDCVIPAWSAGIQINMDVSGSILANLDAGYPCRHDKDLSFHVP